MASAAYGSAHPDVDVLRRLRLYYRYPREIRPALIAAMAGNPVVADYFDLSLQHSAPELLPEVEGLRAERNEASDAIGLAKRERRDAARVRAKVLDIRE